MGLSQRELGVLAGLDPSVASPRMNQYERQTHHPSYSFLKKLARALRKPVAYFFAADDELAELIGAYSVLGARQRADILRRVRALERRPPTR